MVTNGSIPGCEHHVSNLPFTDVSEGSVACPFVLVAESFSTLASKQKDEWLAGRCRNTSLLLPAERVVDVAATTILMLDFEFQMKSRPILASAFKAYS